MITTDNKSAIQVKPRGTLPFHLAPVAFSRGQVSGEQLELNQSVEFPEEATRRHVRTLERWPDGSVRWAHAEWTTVNSGKPGNGCGEFVIIDSHGSKTVVDLNTAESTLTYSSEVYAEWLVRAKIPDGDYEIQLICRDYLGSVVHCWIELTCCCDSRRREIVEAYWQHEAQQAVLRHEAHRQPSVVDGGDRVWLWLPNNQLNASWPLSQLYGSCLSGRLPFEDSDRLAVHPETRREVNIATDANGYTPGTTAWSAYTGNTAGLTLAAEVLLWNGKPEDCPSQEALDNGPLGYVDPAYLCGTGAAGSITPCNDPQHPIDVAVKADLRAQFSLGRNVGYTGLLLDGLTPEWVYPSEDRADLHRSISYRLQGLDCRLLVALADNSITELFARHAFNLRHVGSCNADIPELNMSAYTAKAGKNSPSPLGRWEGPRGKNIDPPVVMGQHWCQPEHQRWAGILAGDMSAWRWWQGWLERERNRTIVKDYGGRGASTALQTYVEAYESTGEESFRLKMKTLLGRITSVPATEQVAKLGTSPLWRPNAVTLAYFALYGRNWEKNPDWDAVEWARVMRWLDEAARQTSVGVLPLTASVTGFLGYDYISEELAHFPTTLHGPGDKWQGYGPVPTQRLIDQWPHAKWRYPHIKPRTKYRSYPCTPANFASRSGKVSLRLIIWHDGGPLEFWLRATQMARGDIHATSFVLRGLEGEKEIPLPEDVAQVFTRWGGRNPSTRLSVDLPAGTYSLEVRSHQVALQAPVCPKARCEIAVLEPGVSYQCAPTRGLLESSEQTKLTATTGSKDRPHAINGEQMMGFAGKRQLNVPVGTSRLNITGAEYSYVSFSLPAQAFLRVVPQ